MDTLLSQLKGQGSPFSSPTPISNNVDKLLDTIHILSKATLLVAQQLPERKQPDNIHLPTPRLTPKPTPQSSPRPSAKKTPPPSPTSAPVLSWVPRAPEYYSLPQPNPIITTHTSVPPTAKPPTAKPIPRTPHTKKDRKPKRKRTKPSTQPNPSPTPSATTLATPFRPVQTDQREPPAQNPPLSPIPSRPAQTDQREPPAQTHPLPTPTTSSSPAQPEQRWYSKEAIAQRRLAKKEQCKLAAPSSTPKPTSPTPKPPSPIYKDVTAPVAPANTVVNFPHTYDDCPRLPECPAHRVEFAVYSQAYADRSRNAPRPPSFPQPYAGSGFELRCERDTAWWPVPPSVCSSPPGTPADSDAFLSPPPDDDSHLI